MASPRYETRLPDGLESWSGEIEESAQSLGTPLMDWQSKGAQYLGARRSDGRPRYKTVILSVPRQSGKTVLAKSTVKARAEQAPRLELFGTAQSRQYAAKHVLKLGASLGSEVKVLRGVGAESVTWPNGSTYLPLSPTDGGGHGDSIDFMLVDEGWKLTTTVMGGIRPAMIARPDSQLLIISTMGTVDSHLWNGLVTRGRESIDDPDSDMAYLEYSAPSDEAIFEDDCTDDSRIGTPECVWGQWMPALGFTITHGDIRAAIEDMLADPNGGTNEVVRAFGNRTAKTLVAVFQDDWLRNAYRVIEKPHRFVIGVDVNESPPGASITTGHLTEDGEPVGRLAEWKFGSPHWVPGVVDKMMTDREVETIVADFGGPARVLKTELEVVADRHNVPVVDRQPRDLAADTAAFYDDLREGRIALENSAPLAEALEGAQRKTLGEGMWLVSRTRMSVDASPAISVIQALGLAKELDIRPVIRAFIL